VFFSKNGYGIVAVARRQEMLEETKKLGESNNFNLVCANVATPEGRDAIAKAVHQFCPKKLNFIIQNAGVIGNITKIENIDYDSWRSAFAVNVDAPLFLTQKLLPELAKDARILHIGSGAAHGPLAGWGTYNVSKAAFHMLYRCLEKELGPKGIHVGSVKPGIIETNMQETIRAASQEDMALVDRFKFFKENEYKGADALKPHKPPKDGLDTPENVAFFVNFLLNDVSSEEFTEKEWDIRDEDNHDRWIK